MMITRNKNMQAAEARFGRPIRQIIPDLYAQLRNYDAVARTLGISRQQLHTWRVMLGLDAYSPERLNEEDRKCQGHQD